MSKKKNAYPPYLDELDLIGLFYRIEERSATPQARRIEQVIETLSNLKPHATASERGQVLARLRRQLAPYRWSLQVSPSSEGFRVIQGIAGRETMSKDDLWEQSAVRDLLSLVPYLGSEPRIRRCANCRCWLYAGRRSDQKFCSPNCKQQAHDSRPENRERKRVTMRKNYAEGKRVSDAALKRARKQR